MNEQEIEKVMKTYDALIEAADKVMALWPGVCGFKPDGSCERGEKTCCQFIPSCPYLAGNDGCTVKCLACKLWYCPEIEVRHPLLAEAMRCIRYRSAALLPRLAFHESREEYVEGLRAMADPPLVMG